ncbi:MAG: hypothetical protein Q9O62_05590 [Ardenticatenia bacterium]|nr:hypothetical protein [Ardenticatenia bacterium]
MCALLAFFSFVLLLVLVLNRLVTQQVLLLFWLLTRDERLPYLLYAVLLLPGMLVHEGSHWLAARLLRVPARRPSLRPRARGSRVVLGHVITAPADPLRQSAIGAAPLIMGSSLVILVARYIFGVNGPETLLPGGQSFRELMGQLVAVTRVENAWLWLYLLFSVGHMMLPSESDRTAWPVLLAVTGVSVLVVFLFFGVPASLVALLNGLIWALLFTFLITIAVDILLFVTCWALNRVLMGRQP